VAYQRPQDFAVINTDYPASKKFLTLTPAEKATISHENSVAKGCYISSDAKIFVHGLGVDDTSPFLNQSELLLRGVHNLQNISASIAIGLRLGISPESLKNSVRSFKGLEHRLELVGQFGGVSFYNDSFATVPETTIAALEAFTEPLILIVGGSEKHSDFTELGQTIVNKQNLKALIVIGESGPRIIEAINKAGQTTAKIFTDAQTIDEIFAQIKETASVGDVVLLSPACASFGMFANYKDRGYKFKNLSKSFGGQA
jgi:UDP-N-acetylmuramoylalanine--D-glutamate ligase